MKRLIRMLQNPRSLYFPVWLVVIGLIFSAASKAFDAISLIASDKPQLAAQSDLPETSKNLLAEQRPLQMYQLFGQFERQYKNPSAPSPAQNAPETNLTLTLLGVTSGMNGQLSGAIVSNHDGNSEYFRVGDSLPGNAELVRVEPNRIFLRRNGQYETLSFEGRDENGDLYPPLIEPMEKSISKS